MKILILFISIFLLSLQLSTNAMHLGVDFWPNPPTIIAKEDFDCLQEYNKEYGAIWVNDENNGDVIKNSIASI